METKKTRINEEYERSYWIGYLAGVINGISNRTDVSDKVRQKCRDVVKRYKDWSEAWKDNE